MAQRGRRTYRVRTQRAFETRWYSCGYAIGLATLEPTADQEFRTYEDSGKHYLVRQTSARWRLDSTPAPLDTFPVAFDSIRAFYNDMVAAYRGGCVYLLPGFSRTPWNFDEDALEAQGFDPIKLIGYDLPSRWRYPPASSSFACQRDGDWGVYQISRYRDGVIAQLSQGYSSIRPSVGGVLLRVGRFAELPTLAPTENRPYSHSA